MDFCEFKACMFQSGLYSEGECVCARTCVHACTRAKVCFLKGSHRLFVSSSLWTPLETSEQWPQKECSVHGAHCLSVTKPHILRIK